MFIEVSNVVSANMRGTKLEFLSAPPAVRHRCQEVSVKYWATTVFETMEFFHVVR